MLSPYEGVFLAIAVAATVAWIATIAIVAFRATLTPAQRAGWLIAVALTHIVGAVAFLVWDRGRGR